jgi:acetylornithine/N-succinyldiaminopimelate aminotransferase
MIEKKIKKTARNTIEESKKFVLNTYNRFPLVFVKGKGIYLYTIDGRKFLDMATGIAVNLLGHSHPSLIKAIGRQSKKLIHTSNLYYTEPYIELAKILIKKSIFDKAFFCNSGTEANEAAFKLARKHGKKAGGNKKFEIVSMKDSFHGRTLGALTATGQTKYQKGFDPLLPGVKYAQFNNINSIKKAINKNTCALILEPVQGEGGIIPATMEFIKAARELTAKNNALLIYDEIQTGLGRTGKLFGYEHFLPSEPDVITLAKGLAGGLPIGAMLVKEKYSDLLGPGEHASTFGGNLVSCASAIEVFNIIDKSNLLQNACRMGDYFMSKLKALKDEFKVIADVRGLGLHIGVEVKADPILIINKLIENNLLTVKAGENVVRFLPPLIVSKIHIDEAVEIFRKVLKEL